MYVRMCEMYVRVLVHVHVHVRVSMKADGEIFFVRNEAAYVSNMTYHNTVEHKMI